MMKITVIGAYGYTGRLIAYEFQNANIAFSIAGKNMEKLTNLKEEFKEIVRVFNGDIRNENFITEIINESDIIVNCAGPFTEESECLLEKIAISGKVYLDISGELGFIRNSKEKYDTLAKEYNSLIIHGCAFESLIVDLLTSLMSFDGKKIKEVNAYYWFNQNRVSPGTRMTMKLAKFRQSLKINNSEWQTSSVETDRFNFQWSNEQEKDEFIAVAYPLPETAFFQWKFAPEKAQTFLLLPKNEAQFLGNSKGNSDKIDETLEQLKKIKKAGPSAEERMGQRSKIFLEFRFEKGDYRYTALENANMYRTTALAILFAVQKIMETPFRPAGVQCPSVLFKGVEEKTIGALDCASLRLKKIKVTKC